MSQFLCVAGDECFRLDELNGIVLNTITIIMKKSVSSLFFIALYFFSCLPVQAEQGLFRAVAYSDTSCNWPDSGSLSAVLPVAAADGSYASGVVVGRNRVLTAAHAIAPETRVYVGIDNQFRAAKIQFVDKQNDLAILVVDTGRIPPLRIASGDPALRQQVWAVGFPRAKAKTTSAGVFQKKSEGALHTSAPIDSGQSGGGLLLCSNGSYMLAGMLRGYGAYFKGGQYVKLANHSVSVAAATIQRFVNLESVVR